MDDEVFLIASNIRPQLRILREWPLILRRYYVYEILFACLKSLFSCML